MFELYEIVLSLSWTYLLIKFMSCRQKYGVLVLETISIEPIALGTNSMELFCPWDE